MPRLPAIGLGRLRAALGLQPDCTVCCLEGGSLQSVRDLQVALTEAVDMVFEMADGREMVLTL